MPVAVQQPDEASYGYGYPRGDSELMSLRSQFGVKLESHLLTGAGIRPNNIIQSNTYFGKLVGDPD